MWIACFHACFFAFMRCRESTVVDPLYRLLFLSSIFLSHTVQIPQYNRPDPGVKSRIFVFIVMFINEDRAICILIFVLPSNVCAPLACFPVVLPATNAHAAHEHSVKQEQYYLIRQVPYVHLHFGLGLYRTHHEDRSVNY